MSKSLWIWQYCHHVVGGRCGPRGRRAAAPAAAAGRDSSRGAGRSGARPGGKIQIIVNGQPVELKGDAVKIVPEMAKLGQYWLGLMVGPLGDEQRKEMKMPEGQGVVVQQVVPDSPAAKAEFKEKDVLLKAGDKPLKSVEDLLAAVNEAKDKPLAVVLLREGKEHTIKVTPAKRPAMEGGDLEHLQKLFGTRRRDDRRRRPGRPARCSASTPSARARSCRPAPRCPATCSFSVRYPTT